MSVRSTVLLLISVLPLSASEALDKAHQLEDAGDSIAARDLYAKAIRLTPNDAELLGGYADFLSRFHDPGAAAAYRKAASVWKADGKTQDAAAAARRAVLLDLIRGDRKAADADLAGYRAFGGMELQLPEPARASAEKQSIDVPGPLRSFARMAAISPDAAPEDVLPALARNVVTNGYQASRSNDELEETEYLKLVRRYLSQARELEKLAGPDKILKVPNCES